MDLIAITKRNWLSFAATALVVLAACSEESGRESLGEDSATNQAPADAMEPDAMALVVEPPQLVLNPGDVVRLLAHVTLDDGSTDEPACAWTSSDEHVASVDRDGTVTAHSIGGTVVVVGCSGMRADVRVDVVEAPTSVVEIVEEVVTLGLPHESREIPVEAQTAEGVALAPDELVWTSTDDSVVRADDGMIVTIGEGEAVVRASYRDAFDDVLVRVLAVDTLRVIPQTATLYLDETVQLSLEYVAADGTVLSPAVPVTWSVSDSSRASISDDGEVTPISPGPISITARSASREAHAEVAIDVRFVDLDCTLYECCAVDATGRGYCFGRNRFGSLGVGEDEDVSYPRELVGETRFDSITVGLWYACGLDRVGAAHCWGWNAWGRLGYGEPDSGYPPHGQNAIPARVPNAPSLKSLALGIATYGISEAGELYAWGFHPPSDHVMPYPPPTHPSPTLIDPGPWSSIFNAANTLYICGLKQGELWCQGTSDYGQLGQGGPATARMHFDDWVQYELPTSAAIVDVATGQHNLCALDELGEVWCSGLNIYGALGLPYEHPFHQENASRVPRRTAFGRTFDSLIGNTRSVYCGVSKRDVYCWGRNGSCQLGWDPGFDTSNPDHWTSHSHTPVHLDFLPKDWTKIALAAAAGCLIDVEGALWCWGLHETSENPLDSGMDCDPSLQRVLPYEF